MCTAIDEMRKESRNEGWLEGQKDGWQKSQKDGIMEALSSLVNKGLLLLSVAASEAGLSADEFLAKTADTNRNNSYRAQ